MSNISVEASPQETLVTDDTMDPRWTICRKMTDLPDLDLLAKEQVLGVDVETTSYDDLEAGFHPYHGHRICGVGIFTEDGHGWYLPLRHHAPEQNLPLEPALDWLRRLGKQRADRKWVGHNIKFDLKFFAVDDIWLLGDYLCTMLLSRIIDTLAFSAQLKILTKLYLSEEFRKKLVKDDENTINPELKRRKTKDYGKLPIRFLGPYCLLDLKGTLELLRVMLQKLMDISKDLWLREQKVCRTLFQSEHRGIWVPRGPLVEKVKEWLVDGMDYKAQRDGKEVIEKTKGAIELGDRVNELCGFEVDCLSNKQLTEAMARLCIQPRAFGKDGPSWDGATLRSYDLPVTDAIADFKDVSATISAFGEGWLKRLTVDELLHPNFKQAGTKTGRLSSEDPNFQNLSWLAKLQVCPRPGYHFISIDYSQIEFRLFAHYTNSAAILGKYKQDPWTDYHQSTADLMGVDRSSAKTVNFGMIYGMGMQKLVNQLTSRVVKALKEGDIKFLSAMEAFNFGEEVTMHNAHLVAQAAYNEYHRQFPEIKQFQKLVEQVMRQRGWVKNIFGRVYKLPQEMAHRARNYVVQGGAADILKDRLALMPELLLPFGAHLLCNVHDEVLVECPIEEVEPCLYKLVPMLETPTFEFRVPIKVEVAICKERWGKKEKWEKMR